MRGYFAQPRRKRKARLGRCLLGEPEVAGRLRGLRERAASAGIALGERGATGLGPSVEQTIDQTVAPRLDTRRCERDGERDQRLCGSHESDQA